jgi:hypothetical protein
MKLIATIIHNNSERLLLEYPISEALKIYGRRLFIFSIVVIANLVLLGAVLFASRFPVLSLFVLITAIFLSLFIVLKRWGRVILRTLIRAPKEDSISADFLSTLAEVQKLGGLNSEELHDAIIALRLGNNIEEEATKFGLATNAIEFVEGLECHTLHIGQILEG